MFPLPSDFIIRNALINDLPRVSALANYVWLDTYSQAGVSDDFAHYVQSELSVDQFTQIYQVKNQEIVVCEHDGYLVGFALLGYGRMSPNSNGEQVELIRLYVHPCFKRRGIGTQLLASCFRRCLQASFSSLWLTVYAGNHAAVAFYETQGFVRIGETYFKLNDQKHLNYVYQHSK